MLVTDGKLQYACWFTAADPFGLLGSGIYKAEICSSCSYVPSGVLLFQGFVQGLRYHQTGLSYCKNSTQLTISQASQTLLGLSFSVAISSYYEN